jgi:hypothetical protein
MNKPKYIHDCDKCVFLGHLLDRDIYFCKKGNSPTIILRYGNDGPEYLSGLCFATQKMLDSRVGLINTYEEEYKDYRYEDICRAFLWREAILRAVSKGLLPIDWESKYSL